jgi:tetratricopeptide (TPR) repeat protein
MIWVFANTNTAAAERRNINLADERLWNKHRIALYYEELGAYYREKPDLNTSAEYYQKGLEIEPDRERLVTNLSYVYQKMKNYAGAENVLNDYINRGFKKRDIYFRLGIIQMEESKYKDAEENFQKILVGNPSDFEALGNISVCYYLQKNYSASIDFSKKLVGYYPENPKPYLSLGDAYLGAGDMTNALNNYNKAAELDNDKKYEIEINSRLLHFKK